MTPKDFKKRNQFAMEQRHGNIAKKKKNKKRKESLEIKANQSTIRTNRVMIILTLILLGFTVYSLFSKIVIIKYNSLF
jgi:hypothetical protein